MRLDRLPRTQASRPDSTQRTTAKTRSFDPSETVAQTSCRLRRGAAPRCRSRLRKARRDATSLGHTALLDRVAFERGPHLQFARKRSDQFQIEQFEQRLAGMGDRAVKEHRVSVRQPIEERLLDRAAGFRHRRQQDRPLVILGIGLQRGQEVVGRDDRIHRQPGVHGVAQEPVAEEDLARPRRRPEYLLVMLVERIDPGDQPGLIREVAHGRQDVRDHFVGALVRHFSVGVVDGQELDEGWRRDLRLAVDARQRQRQIDVVRLAAIAVEPGAVQPPRVVGVEAERE